MFEDEGDHEYRDVGGASAETNDIPTGADNRPEDGEENKESAVERTDGGSGDVGKETPATTQPGIEPDKPISLKPEPERRSEPERPRRSAKHKKKSSWSLGGYGSRRTRKSR